jgi:hypothetical protein
MLFIDQLKNDVAQELRKLDELPVINPGTEFKVGVIDLLKMALKNEIEASELAALWLPTTSEIEAKLGLARQCGDEAKHYRLIEKRLLELGAQLDNFSPLAAGYSPLFQWLSTLPTTIERIAAGPFAREAIAIKRNAQFIALLTAMGDNESAALYQDQIQPDEEWHHNFGVVMLQKYAVTPEQQEQARNAALRTLALADELREAAMAKTGACAIPGC